MDIFTLHHLHLNHFSLFLHFAALVVLRKTVMARLVLWLVGWVWIGRLFILLGFVAAGLYYCDVTLLGCRMLSCESCSLQIGKVNRPQELENISVSCHLLQSARNMRIKSQCRGEDIHGPIQGLPMPATFKQSLQFCK